VLFEGPAVRSKVKRFLAKESQLNNSRAPNQVVKILNKIGEGGELLQ
jgi:hypothetical protein